MKLKDAKAQLTEFENRIAQCKNLGELGIVEQELNEKAKLVDQLIDESKPKFTAEIDKLRESLVAKLEVIQQAKAPVEQQDEVPVEQQDQKDNNDNQRKPTDKEAKAARKKEEQDAKKRAKEEAAELKRVKAEEDKKAKEEAKKAKEEAKKAEEEAKKAEARKNDKDEPRRSVVRGEVFDVRQQNTDRADVALILKLVEDYIENSYNRFAVGNLAKAENVLRTLKAVLLAGCVDVSFDSRMQAAVNAPRNIGLFACGPNTRGMERLNTFHVELEKANDLNKGSQEEPEGHDDQQNNNQRTRSL